MFRRVLSPSPPPDPRSLVPAHLVPGGWPVLGADGGGDDPTALPESVTLRDVDAAELVTTVLPRITARPGVRVETLGTETVPRVSGRWSMARVTDGDEPDIPPLMHQAQGGISPAAPRATTPEQDAAPDPMPPHLPL